MTHHQDARALAALVILIECWGPEGQLRVWVRSTEATAQGHRMAEASAQRKQNGWRQRHTPALSDGQRFYRQPTRDAAEGGGSLPRLRRYLLLTLSRLVRAKPRNRVFFDRLQCGNDDGILLRTLVYDDVGLLLNVSSLSWR